MCNILMDSIVFMACKSFIILTKYSSNWLVRGFSLSREIDGLIQQMATYGSSQQLGKWIPLQSIRGGVQIEYQITDFGGL